MMPLEFQNRMKDMLGDRFLLFLNEFENQPFRALRLNTIKCDLDTLKSVFDFVTEPTGFCSTSFYIKNGLKLGNHPMHHAGAFYIQEPSASSVVEALGIDEGDKVLDLCASPGGKSTAAACKIGKNGLLVSNEFVMSRVAPLVSNIERMGIANAVVTSMRPDELCNSFFEFFDKVIVDAPCSGEGMFRKESAAVQNWSVENVKTCAARQLKILESAKITVRVGGRLVYSTCTYSPEENEMVINSFLKLNSNFKLVKPFNEFGESAFARFAPDVDNAEYARRIFNFNGGEGHFVAVMEKIRSNELVSNGGIKHSAPKKSNTHETEKNFREFFAENFMDNIPQNISVQGDKVYIIPNLNDFPDIKTVRKGIFAGVVKNNRFCPEHALFNTPMFTAKRNIELDIDDPLVGEFLHGQELAVSDTLKGYCAVKVCGIPLGFGKASGGRLKNHYPKGLRTL